MSLNYPILKSNYDFFISSKNNKKESINNFYKDNFCDIIDTIIEKRKNNIKNENINNNKKEIHKEKMVKLYIIPLTFLIYSYIYIKYYNKQIIIENESENKLNFEIFTKFLFSHDNPVIKKVNVFFHKLYKKDNNILNNNKKENTNTDLINNIKEYKTNTIAFINFLINKLNDYGENDSKDLEIMESINDKINNSIINIHDICKLFNQIDNSYKDVLDFNNSIISNNIKINELIDKFKDTANESFKDKILALNDITNFESIENTINNINKIYIKLTEKIKFINENILKINNLDSEFQIITEDIKPSELFEIYKKYYDFYIKIKEKNNKNQENIKNFKNIIVNLENQIELYDELSNKKNNIRTYKESYIYIANILLNYYKNETSVTNVTNVNHIINNFELDTTLDTGFKNLIDLFIFSYLINSTIEINYLSKKYNQSTNIFEKNIKNIKDIKKIFVSKFREFKKDNNDYLKFLNILKDKKKYIEKKKEQTELENNKISKNNKKKITELNTELQAIKTEITSIESNIKTYEGEKKKLEKLSNIVKIYDDINIKSVKDIFNTYLFTENNLRQIKEKQINSKIYERNIKKLLESIKNYEKIITPIKSSLKDKKTKMDSACSELSKFKAELNAFKITETELYKKIKDLDNESKNATTTTARKGDIDQEIKKLRNELKTCHNNINKKNEEIVKIKNICDSFKSKYNSDKKNINVLEKKIYNNTKNKNKKEEEKQKFNLTIRKIPIKSLTINNIKGVDKDMPKNIDKLYINFLSSINDTKRISSIKILGSEIDTIINTIIDINTFNDLDKEYKSITTDKTNRNTFTQIITIYLYYNNTKKDYEDKLSKLESTKNNIDIKKKDLQKNIFFKTYKNDSIIRQKDNLDNLLLLIGPLIDNLIKISSSSPLDKNDIKREFNTIFDNTIILTEKLEERINYFDYNKSSNKIYHLYKNNNKELINYVNNLSTLNKLNNLNKLSKYLSETPDNFIDSILNEIKDKNTNQLDPFLEQFKEYDKKLKDKLNYYLDKINNNQLKIKKVDLSNNFNKIISKKKKLKDVINRRINTHINTPINNIKKGKYTVIIPYTDILLLYFIDMLIVIDALTIFYE